ncbi:hypothetical protein T484DRAFT_1757721 [Baffinella frigidus]|nr:hypothetical protein T484DRAFT_1757721 [Cryptophyta sp. CCMP2293]
MSYDELPFDIHLKILKLACTPLVEHCYLEFINQEEILDFDGNVLTKTIHDTDDKGHVIHCWLDPYIVKMKQSGLMTIINDFGGVFKAISKYQDEFGDFPIDSKNEIKNYWTLAYIIIEEYIRDKLDEDGINEQEEESDEDSDEESDDEEESDDSDDPDYDPNCDEE